MSSLLTVHLIFLEETEFHLSNWHRLFLFAIYHLLRNWSLLAWQREYEAAKPEREAAARAKAAAEAEEASLAAEVPLHNDNEWNIRSVL